MNQIVPRPIAAPAPGDKIHFNVMKVIMIIEPSILSQNNQVQILCEGGMVLNMTPQTFEKNRDKFNQLVTLEQ